MHHRSWERLHCKFLDCNLPENEVALDGMSKLGAPCIQNAGVIHLEDETGVEGKGLHSLCVPF